MGPLRGWELPPWSQAPKADALSQALYLLLLGSLPWALATAPCKEEEYPVGSECCPKCSPGYRVKEACGELTGTVCAPCDPGTYTAHLNGLSECLQCRMCDPAMALVTRQKCSRTENTVCACAQGHFCISENEDDCVECRPHTPCKPGQRLVARGEPKTPCSLCSAAGPPGPWYPLESQTPDPRPQPVGEKPSSPRLQPLHPLCQPCRFSGTERRDTMCEDCPPGTFSPNGTLEQCQPWTMCSGPFQREAHAGTSSSDVTCSSWGPPLMSSFLGILVLFVLISLCFWMKHRRQHERSTKSRTFQQVPQAPPDVTTVAMEETASMPPAGV